MKHSPAFRWLSVRRVPTGVDAAATPATSAKERTRAGTGTGSSPFSSAVPPTAATGGTPGFFAGPAPSRTQGREREVLSLCGRKMVWTLERDCGCETCRRLR